MYIYAYMSKHIYIHIYTYVTFYLFLIFNHFAVSFSSDKVIHQKMIFNVILP